MLGNTGEEISEIRKLSQEKILARWINYHLKGAGVSHIHIVQNIETDLKDLVPIFYVLN